MANKKHPSKKTTLTEKEKIFVNEYVTNGFNITHSYIKSYPKSTPRTAEVNGCRLLRKDRVRKEVQLRIQEVLDRYKETLEKKIVDTYMKRAFYDPSEWFNPDCTLKENGWERLTESGYGIIIDGMEDKNGKPTYKLADRDKALSMLAKYMQIMAEQVEVKGLTIHLNAKDAPL